MDVTSEPSPDTPQFLHLHPSVRELMAGSNDDRRKYIYQNQWIPHTRARETFKELNRLLTHSKTKGLASIFIVGPTGAGKSTLLEYFRNSQPITRQPDNMVNCSVVLLKMPPEPNETRLWSEILLTLRIAHRYSDSPHEKQKQAHGILGRIKCRMLIFDELHRMLHGPITRQRQIISAIKNLSEELSMPVVVAGTLDALRAWHVDDEMKRRWKRFDFSKFEPGEEFLRVVRNFEGLLPLAKPSGLNRREMVEMLYDLSSGLMGELVEILRKAAENAIESGAEQIDLDTLRRLNWSPIHPLGR